MSDPSADSCYVGAIQTWINFLPFGRTNLVTEGCKLDCIQCKIMPYWTQTRNGGAL